MISPVDERIFAVDVVASSLRRHLGSLQSDAPLNVKAATRGWILHDRVMASPEPGIEEFV
jgi:hypothetical protein